MENAYNVLLDKLEDIIDAAKAVPLTQRHSIDRNEVYDILNQLRLNTPAEIQQGQRIVAKAQKLLNDANDQATKIIRDAEARAEKMTMDKEIVKRAQDQADAILSDANEDARHILDNARIESRNMRVGSIKYADELLNNTSRGLQTLLDNMSKRTAAVEDYIASEIDAIYGERKELSNLNEIEKK
ncbi:MAG: hypothetical protein IJS61_03950 [Firmicutes bacterium]|nr:hypothetical protein [Bacillota bacterium]